MKEKIKAIILDVGDVLFLVKNKSKRETKNLLSSFKEACLLLKGINLNWDKYEVLREIYQKSSKGEISKKQTLNLFSKELGVSAKRVENSFREVYKNNTMENRSLYKKILALKKQGYKIGLLSIQFHLSKKVLIPKKYYQNFDALEISCDDKLKKPDEKAFKFVLKKLKVKPEEAIFVDDKQENLDAARNLGMQIILFQNNKQFIKDLNGILK